jgi:hypothetical protein
VRFDWGLPRAQAAGYATDVTLGAEHDVQDTVPLLTGPAFGDDALPPRQI